MGFLSCNTIPINKSNIFFVLCTSVPRTRTKIRTHLEVIAEQSAPVIIFQLLQGHAHAPLKQGKHIGRDRPLILLRNEGRLVIDELDQALVQHVDDIDGVLDLVLEDGGREAREKAEIVAAHFDEDQVELLAKEVKVLEDTLDGVVEARVPALVEDLVVDEALAKIY